LSFLAADVMAVPAVFALSTVASLAASTTLLLLDELALLLLDGFARVRPFAEDLRVLELPLDFVFVC
jgi:hypothetical protein